MQYKSLVLAALASAASAQSSASLMSVLGNQSMLSNLTGYLNTLPQFSQQLAQLQNVTLLAPSNAAFAAFMNTSTAGALATDSQLIQGILSYHVLNGTYANITNTSFIHTALQPPTYTNVTGGQVVEATHGKNTTFYSGLLMNSTVTSTMALNFSGGVIHVIDRLLTIPQNCSATAIDLNATAAVGAIEQAGLVDVIDNTRDLTVFVPSNDAFASIGSATGNLTKEQLTSILQYHVLNGTVAYSTMLMNGSSVMTAGGMNVTIRIMGGHVYVNSAKVIVPNVLVANGVIHVIDGVLNPMNSTAMPNSSKTMPAFAGATSGTGVPYTSGVPTPTSAIQTSMVESAMSSASAGASSSSSGGAYMPQPTGAMGAAALFGGAAVLLNM